MRVGGVGAVRNGGRRSMRSDGMGTRGSEAKEMRENLGWRSRGRGVVVGRMR